MYLSSSYTVLMHGIPEKLNIFKLCHNVMCTSPVTENFCNLAA